MPPYYTPSLFLNKKKAAARRERKPEEKKMTGGQEISDFLMALFAEGVAGVKGKKLALAVPKTILGSGDSVEKVESVMETCEEELDVPRTEFVAGIIIGITKLIVFKPESVLSPLTQ